MDCAGIHLLLLLRVLLLPDEQHLLLTLGHILVRVESVVGMKRLRPWLLWPGGRGRQDGIGHAGSVQSVWTAT